MGWFWGRLGRHRVLLLTKGAVEMPSDFFGMHHLSYRESPLEVEREIIDFLNFRDLDD